MARLRDSWRTSLSAPQQPRNPQPESITRNPYDDLAEALGRSGEAVRALVIRKRWRRTLENDGRALWERRRERCGRSVRARAGSGAAGGATWRSLQRLPLQRRSRPPVSPIRQRYRV